MRQIYCCRPLTFSLGFMLVYLPVKKRKKRKISNSANCAGECQELIRLRHNNKITQQFILCKPSITLSTTTNTFPSSHSLPSQQRKSEIKCVWRNFFEFYCRADKKLFLCLFFVMIAIAILLPFVMLVIVEKKFSIT